MNRSLKKIPLAALCAAMAAACAGGATDATITVDASKVEGSVTPWLYGACIEDVNHEIYGGLYDQRIFGESFEEPVPNPLFDDCSAYEGEWQVAGDELLCAAHAGAKLVYDPLEMAAGEVETELKFTRGGGGDNAGLLAGVSEPGNGADNFHGYEISLAADGRKVVLGKHKNNFTPIADAAVSCDPAQWNRLGFKTDGRTLQVFLNGACVLRAEDDDPVLARGRVALRTWNSEARFRNVKVTADGASRKLVFRTTPAVQVSRQWDAFSTGGAVAAYRHEAGDAYNGACSQSVEFVSGTGTVGIANAGLNRWGIAMRKGQTFEGRLYLRGSGDVVVALQSADGTKEYASQRITGIGAAWKKFPFELTAAAADGDARFALYLDRPGRVQADQVTLMSTGEDRFRGLPLRGDIGQAMVDQGLTFLRYGGTMINISGYRFKKMIGDRDKRPPYHGHWYRWSTNGFGIEDFLQFCEKAGFTAAFAVNIDAIKGKDPSVKLISTAWWRADSPSMERTFRALDGKADYWDYHPWADQLASGREVEAELRRMRELFLRWNPSTTMKCAIFEENGNRHDMQRVLGHVTLQNAVRRMGDFVLTSCAANALQPYRQNDNGWDQGQVFFTPSQVWGMPPYYAQQMAAAHHRPLTVGCGVEGADGVLDVTATRSREAGSVVLHIANTGAEPLRVGLRVDGMGKVSQARMVSLSGDLDAVNTPEEPRRIAPVGRELPARAAQTVDIAPYSYTIVVLDE